MVPGMAAQFSHLLIINRLISGCSLGLVVSQILGIAIEGVLYVTFQVLGDCCVGFVPFIEFRFMLFVFDEEMFIIIFHLLQQDDLTDDSILRNLAEKLF
jgi:hypothetical protein